MKIDIGLSKESCAEVSKLLNKILSNEYVLYTKTLNYHWNLIGPDFDAIHKFFERLYEQSFDIIDEVAERVRALGNTSYGTLIEFLQDATIKENPADAHNSQMAMIEQLLYDHETIIKQMRDAIPVIQSKYKDEGTANFLTEIMEKHEKTAWMLRSFFTE